MLVYYIGWSDYYYGFLDSEGICLILVIQTFYIHFLRVYYIVNMFTKPLLSYDQLFFLLIYNMHVLVYKSTVIWGTSPCRMHVLGVYKSTVIWGTSPCRMHVLEYTSLLYYWEHHPVECMFWYTSLLYYGEHHPVECMFWEPHFMGCGGHKLCGIWLKIPTNV